MKIIVGICIDMDMSIIYQRIIRLLAVVAVLALAGDVVVLDVYTSQLNLYLLVEVQVEFMSVPQIERGLPRLYWNIPFLFVLRIELLLVLVSGEGVVWRVYFALDSLCRRTRTRRRRFALAFLLLLCFGVCW